MDLIRNNFFCSNIIPGPSVRSWIWPWKRPTARCRMCGTRNTIPSWGEPRSSAGITGRFLSSEICCNVFSFHRGFHSQGQTPPNYTCRESCQCWQQTFGTIYHRTVNNNFVLIPNVHCGNQTAARRINPTYNSGTGCTQRQHSKPPRPIQHGRPPRPIQNLYVLDTNPTWDVSIRTVCHMRRCSL